MMASADSKLDHLERTATEPRDKSLNTVVLRQIQEVNDTIRLFRLEVPKETPPISFVPGQWLDVFVPGVASAGGFTITSTPADARGTTNAPGYLELAVQRSPDNPPAAWLWRDANSIIGSELQIRVGGSFVWPPPGVDVQSLKRVVLVAGGVGINPLMSMLSNLASGGNHPFEVHFLYSVRSPEEQRRIEASRVLFLERLASIYAEGKLRGQLRLFLTGGSGGEQAVISCRCGEVTYCRRRVTINDVAAAAGDVLERRFAAVYVCGVPSMTDDFVQKLTDEQYGLEPYRVFCEKWW